MQYLDHNYPSKAAARRQLAAGMPIRIRIVEPQISGIPKIDKTYGEVTEHAVAGPWYPEPHKWYGVAVVKDNLVVKIK